MRYGHEGQGALMRDLFEYLRDMSAQERNEFLYGGRYPTHPFSEAVSESEALGAKGAKEVECNIGHVMPEDKGRG